MMISLPPNQLARISSCLGLSLLAHLFLLAAGFAYPVTLPGRPEQTLTVTLGDLRPHLTTMAPKPENPRRKPIVSETLTLAKSAQLTGSDVRQPPSWEERNLVAAVTGSGDDPAKTEGFIRSRLLDRIAKHFQYPMLARLRGWEGTVLLGLRVEPDGQLDRIRVERGSGHAILDRSALNSLHQVGRLAEAPAWLNGQGIDMQLPVIYRLIEN